MNSRAVNRLHDAVDSARLARRFLGNMPLSEYISDLLVQSAVERRLEIVGEALNAARRDEPGLVKDVPNIGRWIGLRNILIHAYLDVRAELVWTTVVEDVPELIQTLERILADADHEAP